MKIPKSTREQAAMICSIAASVPGDVYTRPFTATIANALRTSKRAMELASAARCLAIDDDWNQETDAEAEARLRCGWSPGEEA